MHKNEAVRVNIDGVDVTIKRLRGIRLETPVRASEFVRLYFPESWKKSLISVEYRHASDFAYTAHDALNYCAVWTETPEGHDHWNKVHRALRK